MKDNCLKRERIFALAQRMLSEREEEEAKAHVQRCENCRKALEGYRGLSTLLAEWQPAAEPSPWFDARVRAAVTSAQSKGAARGFLGLRWNRWLALPALASLVLIIGVVTLRNGRWPRAGGVRNDTAAVVVPAQHPKLALPASQAAQELRMYQNLSVLEDYDMLADFDVIPELSKGSHKVAD